MRNDGIVDSVEESKRVIKKNELDRALEYLKYQGPLYYRRI